jgi:Major intrinsic protein
MNTQGAEAATSARRLEPVGKAALIASVGGTRGYADWTNPDHRLRRLLAEFLGMAGLTFILSGGAATLARYGGHGLQPWQVALVLSAVSALWLVVAVYFLGDISAHFNPATTLAFALRKDMDWVMAGAYGLPSSAFDAFERNPSEQIIHRQDHEVLKLAEQHDPGMHPIEDVLTIL